MSKRHKKYQKLKIDTSVLEGRIGDCGNPDSRGHNFTICYICKEYGDCDCCTCGDYIEHSEMCPLYVNSPLVCNCYSPYYYHDECGGSPGGDSYYDELDASSECEEYCIVYLPVPKDLGVYVDSFHPTVTFRSSEVRDR